MTLQEYFPLVAGAWLLLALIVVAIEVIGGIRREHKENNKKLGK